VILLLSFGDGLRISLIQIVPKSLLACRMLSLLLALRTYEFIGFNIDDLSDVNANTFKVVPFITLVASYHLSILIGCSTEAV
jgi:hypothetical protein